MDSKNIEAKLKEIFSHWTHSLEEMRSQLSDGKMNAVENFEKQKKQLKELIETMKSNMDQTIELAEDKGANFKAKLEELNLQLHLGKAETTELFETQRKKIDIALQEVVAAGKLAYQGNYGYMMELFDNNAKAIKTGLEIAQLQFILAKMDAKDGADKARKEIDAKLVELKNAAEKAQELTKENMEHWGKQMKEGMEKMNDWFGSWTKE